MSDQQFFNKYSSKIQAFEANGISADADWELMDKRLSEKVRDRKRRYLIFFTILLFVVTICGIYVYDQNYKVDKQSKSKMPIASIRPIKNDDVRVKNTNPVPEVSHINQLLAIQTNRADQMDINTDVRKVIRDASSKNSYNSILSNDTYQKSTSNQLPTNQISDASLPLANATEKKITGKEIEATDQIRSIVNADSRFITEFTKVGGITFNALYSNELEKVIQIGVPTFPPISQHKPKYFIKLDGGPIIATHGSSSTIMPGKLNFSSHNMSNEVGMQTAINLQIAPNDKWKFSVGINRSQLTHRGTHTASLKLIDGICLNPNSTGPKEYAFTYSVTNGRSSSIVNLRLAEENQGVSLDSTEVFNIEMGMYQKTVSWAFPLTLERKVFSFGDVSIFAKGGVSLGFAKMINEEITHFSESCAELCFHHNLHPNIDKKSYNQFTTGLIIGSSLEWQLAPRIGIMINPEVTNSLSFLNNEQDNKSRWNLNFGVIYSLK